MVHVYARHEVESYERWERFHEANADVRAAHGSLGSTVYRPTRGRDEGTETVLVVLEVDDDRLAETLAYYRSDEFRETMAAAGVVDVADSAVVERVHEMDA
jgi:heme-degrading monooxygenase HmoA